MWWGLSPAGVRVLTDWQMLAAILEDGAFGQRMKGSERRSCLGDHEHQFAVVRLGVRTLFSEAFGC